MARTAGAVSASTHADDARFGVNFQPGTGLLQPSKSVLNLGNLPGIAGVGEEVGPLVELQVAASERPAVFAVGVENDHRPVVLSDEALDDPTERVGLTRPGHGQDLWRPARLDQFDW